MKERLLTGWNLPRVLYLVMGVVILIQSVIAGQWTGMVLGTTFASTGLFGLGCVGGNCVVKPGNAEPGEQGDRDIIYEEIKKR